MKIKKNESNNMDKKNVIRLTESDLKKVITESVKKVLSEKMLYSKPYEDTTIPKEIRNKFHYARSIYATAIEQIQGHQKRPNEHTLSQLQDEYWNVGRMIKSLQANGAECPQNLTTLYQNMSALLKQYVWK